MWQTPKAIGLIALFVAVFVSGVGIVMPADTAYTDDCLAAPNSPAPQGNHWYFRIDRAKKRKCWYFRVLGDSGQQMVAQAASAASSRLQSIKAKSALKAAPSASASTPAGSTPPAPHLEMLAVEPQPAPMIGTRTDEDVEPSGRESSSPASPNPQGLALQIAMTQASLSNPTPAVAALDTTSEAVEQSGRGGLRASSNPQALAFQESATPKVTSPAEDTGVVSLRPKADAPASDSVESPAKRLFQICVSSLSSQFHAFIALGHKWKIGGILALLVLIIGLPVAGILRGVAMKIVRRHRKLVTDHSAPNLIDNQDRHGRRNDQRQQDSGTLSARM